MRTVYLGTSAFAASVLERLARSPHRPALIVTRPDRPKGRGRRLTPPPVAEAAQALGIDLAQPADVNAPDARALIAEAEPEAVAICAFGALIREPLLSAHEMLNVHPSLLPRWRGAAPIERAIEAGDSLTGVSIMRPVTAMDAGPVCLVGEEAIRSDDDFGSLSARLAELGGEGLVEALDRRPPFREQPEEGVTIAAKIDPGERRLDPHRDGAPVLERRVRALNPHVGTWLELPGAEKERLGVRAARSAVPVATVAAGALAVDGGRLLLGCAEGALELLEVQPTGGREMGATDWLRGRGAAYAIPAQPGGGLLPREPGR
jgi:methionyl-tRNA formyltransferase